MKKKKQTKPALARFIVVSYDSDQQQWFYDTVLASDGQSAEAFITENRSYVTDAGAISEDDFLNMGKNLAARSDKSIHGTMEELRKQHADEEDEPYTPTNYFDRNGTVVKRL
jgi:hypothetical protein